MHRQEASGNEGAAALSITGDMPSSKQGLHDRPFFPLVQPTAQKHVNNIEIDNDRPEKEMATIYVASLSVAVMHEPRDSIGEAGYGL